MLILKDVQSLSQSLLIVLINIITSTVANNSHHMNKNKKIIDIKIIDIKLYYSLHDVLILHDVRPRVQFCMMYAPGSIM